MGILQPIKDLECKKMKDRYKKVSEKWWYDTLTNKWIHNDKIDKYLFPQISGTSLPKEFKNKKNKKFY
jgi:hypothetical protein